MRDGGTYNLCAPMSVMTTAHYPTHQTQPSLDLEVPLPVTHPDCLSPYPVAELHRVGSHENYRNHFPNQDQLTSGVRPSYYIVTAGRGIAKDGPGAVITKSSRLIREGKQPL